MARAVRAERIRVGIAFLTHGQIVQLGTVLAGQLARQVRALGNQRNHIHAETVNAAVKPPVIMSYTARRTAGFSQLRSGCFFEN